MANVQDKQDVVTTEKSEQPGHETGLTSYSPWIEHSVTDNAFYKT